MDGPRPLAGCRVLVVEDRFLLAMELSEEIVQLGGDVLGPCKDKGSAASLLNGPVDLAVLDVHLEGETVYSLAVELKSREIPILFVTGYSDEVMPPEWKNTPRIEKPLNPSLFRTLAASLVRREPPPHDGGGG